MASTPTPRSRYAARAHHGDRRAREAHRATLPARPRTDPTAARRERPVATVWVCPVDPPFLTSDVIAAATRPMVTTYTQPGECVLLACPDRLGSRARQDRLVETVLRLGRGVTTRPAANPRADHSTTGPTRRQSTESESGPGLHNADSTVPIAAETISRLDHARPAADRFALIITTQPARTEDPAWITEWADLLTASGTLIVLTHSDHRGDLLTAPSASVSRSAALAGLALTDRLILLHQDPSPAAPAADRDRRRVALGAHRRIHTEALVFRLSRHGGAA